MISNIYANFANFNWLRIGECHCVMNLSDCNEPLFWRNKKKCELILHRQALDWGVLRFFGSASLSFNS